MWIGEQVGSDVEEGDLEGGNVGEMEEGEEEAEANGNNTGNNADTTATAAAANDDLQRLVQLLRSPEFLRVILCLVYKCDVLRCIF